MRKKTRYEAKKQPLEIQSSLPREEKIIEPHYDESAVDGFIVELNESHIIAASVAVG